MANNTMFVPYGFVKIQKLPIGIWSQLKYIDTEKDFIRYLNDNWTLIESIIGNKDKHGIRNKKHLNWSSIKYIYGILTSRALRGGGSKLTSWSLWCYSEENGINIRKICNNKDTSIVIPNRAKFYLSSNMLSIGGEHYKQLRRSSSYISQYVFSVANQVGQRCLGSSLERIDSELKKELAIGNNAIIENESKLCGKVDYLLSGDKEKQELIPIDVNDLHGGLYWIDLFRDHYHQRVGQIIQLKKSIIEYFCVSFIDYFKTKRGCYPKSILICIDDYERWAQDNGLNYIEIKEVATEILSALGVSSTVEISYMESYKAGLLDYIETGDIQFQIVDYRNGKLSENKTKSVDLIVRIYRKIQNITENTISTSCQILGRPLPFVIYDSEEIRPGYYKDNVHAALNNIKSEIETEIIRFPKLIGVYDIDENDIEENIIKDVTESGYEEFVVKLNEKTPFTDISAQFYCASNNMHKKILKDTLAALRKKVVDVRAVIVEPLYPGDKGYKKKIELRTVNVSINSE